MADVIVGSSGRPALRIKPCSEINPRSGIRPQCFVLWPLALLLYLFAQWSVALETQNKILFLANDTLRPGFLQRLHVLGEQHDLDVLTGFAHQLMPNQVPEKIRGRDLVVVFAPSHALPHNDGLVTLREAAEQAQTPLLIVHRDQLEAVRLPQAQAQQLADYLLQGGEENLSRLMQFIAGPVLGDSIQKVPEPIIYPDRGIYHPRYENLVFHDLAGYQAWYGDFGKRPVIGVAIHDTQIKQTMTQWLDTTVALIESAGAVPVVFYLPIRDAEGIPGLLAPEGEPAVDVILFYRVSLNPEGRAEDFAQLGVPVLQGLVYRDGDESDWRADPVGFPQGSTPFYFSMAEMAGITDATIVAAERKTDYEVVAITEQVQTLVQRALNWVDLARRPSADKRLGIYIYNYPRGETNFSASNLNVPQSLKATLEDLSAAGYTTQVPELDSLIESSKHLVGAYYYGADLENLVTLGLADLLPLSNYHQWFASQGQALQKAVAAEWGPPEAAATLIEKEGEKYFVIPRLALDNIIILPQPPRALKNDPNRPSAYHDTDLPFSHDYLASYMYVQHVHQAHAVMHFGTHGSAEFGRGKARGLAVDDDPHAVIGTMPHIYPYIVDNLAESTLARRRSRATIISHQTPPFAPAALYYELVDLHDLVHDWGSMDIGPAKKAVKQRILALSQELSIHADLGFDDASLNDDFEHYLHQLHDYIHAMALQSEPIGLHTLGRSAQDEHLLTTVLQMLGNDYLALVADDSEEVFSGDYQTAVVQSEPYQLLQRYLLLGETLPAEIEPALAAQLQLGRSYFEALQEQRELQAVIAALNGRYIEPSVGGDPIRNPDSLPTGRNLYGFDPSRVPTKAAYDTGVALLEELLAQHQAEHGQAPERLAFTLWSMEVMRHHGVIEGQVLAALGVRPVWSDRGRLEGVELISRQELGRPRVDVVLQASGLYRDAFAGTLALLAEAAALAADQVEADNSVWQMTQSLTKELAEQGLAPEAVHRLARTRAFAADIGQYGIGLDDAVADVDAWAEGDQLDEAYLGRVFLDRLQHAFGPDSEHWGETLPDMNLFARQLREVDAAVFARSSNLYGLLSSDDPFQYLGGLSLGIRTAGGQTPELYISNLRDPQGGAMERASTFISREIRTRYHHPRWLQSMVDEGYSGTTTLQQTIENLWGWQATAPEMVRDDQWQSFFEIYVQDAYDLGLNELFEQHNPQALTHIMERMLDAVRTGHWQAPDEVLQELLTAYAEWADVHPAAGASASREDYVASTLAGFGMGESVDGGGEQSAVVQGQLMQPVAPAASAGQAITQVGWYWAGLAFLSMLGAWRQHRVGRMYLTIERGGN